MPKDSIIVGSEFVCSPRHVCRGRLAAAVRHSLGTRSKSHSRASYLKIGSDTSERPAAALSVLLPTVDFDRKGP